MKIKYLVIHCADTPNEREVTAEEIHHWHSDPKPKGNGWSGIGYNAVIRRSGLIEVGRPEYWPGAHVRDFDGDGNGNNDDSLGVCLVGRESFTDSQWDSLFELISDWKAKYPDAEIVGHCDLDSRKTCPNFDVKKWAEALF